MNYVKAIINSRMLVSNGQNLINYPVNISRSENVDLSSSFIELEVSTIVQDDGVEELHCALLNEYVLQVVVYWGVYRDICCIPTLFVVFIYLLRIPTKNNVIRCIWLLHGVID